MLFIPLALAFWVLVWFDTNAVIEYVELFRLERLHGSLKNYIKSKNQGSPLTFQEYLVQFYSNGFFGRLLTCPICVSAWLGFFAGLIIAPFMDDCLITVTYTAALPFLTLFFYRLINKIK